ncbi:hypothetical protein H8356DRAFT_1335516 [Neocallimastix lanati (nom. inval.)]|nr:hypothetical protein H8356DRAFT_1335516 [Neocallimastix sp. JGI-2020a]
MENNSGLKNITFNNFYDPFAEKENCLFYMNALNLNYKIIFKNCIFNNSESIVLKVDNELTKLNLNNDDVQNNNIIFDFCKFTKLSSSNNKPAFAKLKHESELSNIDFMEIHYLMINQKPSLISIEMGENQKYITFHNVSISDINSNGNVMNFKGYNLNIIFENIVISRSESYGEFINNRAENNFIATAIINTNKFNIGLIYLKNNINIDVSHSIFNDSISYSHGILYLDSVKNIDFRINDSSFSGNSCEYNAKYFGDVIYMDTNKQLNKNYTLSITDSKFLNNQAEGKKNEDDIDNIYSGGYVTLTIELQDELENRSDYAFSNELFYPLIMMDCSSNQIKIMDKNELFNCESSICKNNCHLLENFECLIGNNHINDSEN